MNSFVIDAYAWIEYLEGSQKGEKVRGVIEDEGNLIFTHKVTLSEVISVAKRRDLNAEIAINAIIALSQFYEGDLSFFKEAGILHAELRKRISLFGLADTFVLLTARKLGAKVVTGDPHFKGFKEVLFL